MIVGLDELKTNLLLCKRISIVRDYLLTSGIFSHKLTGSTQVFESNPIIGKRGQPIRISKTVYHVV